MSFFKHIFTVDVDEEGEEEVPVIEKGAHAETTSKQRSVPEETVVTNTASVVGERSREAPIVREVKAEAKKVVLPEAMPSEVALPEGAPSEATLPEGVERDDTVSSTLTSLGITQETPAVIDGPPIGLDEEKTDSMPTFLTFSEPEAPTPPTEVKVQEAVTPPRVHDGAEGVRHAPKQRLSLRELLRVKPTHEARTLSESSLKVRDVSEHDRTVPPSSPSVLEAPTLPTEVKVQEAVTPSRVHDGMGGVMRTTKQTLPVRERGTREEVAPHGGAVNRLVEAPGMHGIARGVAPRLDFRSERDVQIAKTRVVVPSRGGDTGDAQNRHAHALVLKKHAQS